VRYAQAPGDFCIGQLFQLRQQKRLLRRWERMTVDAAIDDSIAEFGEAFKTGEPQHHMNAFLERKSKRS